MSVKKLIKCHPDIDKALKFIVASATAILNKGNFPYIEIGVYEEERSQLQNEKSHAMIGDIAKQAIFKTPGVTVRMADYDIHEAKALLVCWFERECEHIGEPLRHGSRVVVDPFSGEIITIRASTKDFLKKENINFIEWLYSTGCDGNVRWSEPALKEYQQYREAQ